MTTSLSRRPTAGSVSDESAVPGADPSDTSSLLLERLQAYKHACGYLENYITAFEKIEKTHAKEYEKILKTVSDPLKEGHHFDQKLGGIAGLFENIRSNTQGIANAHLENEKNLKGSVLPILERLHTEIKNKSKELSKGTAKGSKEVDKARNTTQKHIEMLGQHTATFSSSGGKVEPANDPYLLRRGINHRLHKQILEENNNRHDLLAVQDSFASFEAHVIATIQQALNAFLQYTNGELEREKAMYADIVSTAQQIPPDFEWKGFVSRNNHILIDPSGMSLSNPTINFRRLTPIPAPKRSLSNITFPNQDHASTKPLIAGSLARKSRVALKGYDTGYYVITPSKYLHQFNDDDDLRKDPSPELSLYLPDCTIGALNGEKFNIKGKDASKGKVGSAMAMNHELAFKAHTSADAEKWHAVIREAGSGASSSLPTSPVESRNVSGQQYALGEKQPAPIQTNQHQKPTGYQASPITPGRGTVPGPAGGGGVAAASPQSAGTTGTGHFSTPTSGVDRQPGQY